MKWYKLIFKQNQSIHIGGLKWGVLNETLLFIPGSTMWGALTNTYLLNNNPYSVEKLEEIKKYFEVITCFYPCFDEDREILFPKFNEGEFYLEKLSEKEFRLYFVDAIMKNSIEPLYGSTKDEHLYEFEFIMPKPKKESNNEELNLDINNLYWVGVICIDEKIKEDFLNKGLKIFIGGDAKYGFGELELININEINREELEKWNLKENNKGNLNINNGGILKNFLEFDNKIKFEGKLLLIPELDFKENVVKVQDAKFFICPGSKILKDLENRKKEKYKLVKGKFILNGE